MLKVAAVVGSSSFDREILCYLLKYNVAEWGEDTGVESDTQGTNSILDHIDEELLLLQNAGVLDVEAKENLCYYNFRNPMMQVPRSPLS